MSAPSTRVFLLPVAIHLAAHGAPASALRTILSHAWQVHNLEQAAANPDRHPYVRLAAALADASREGACQLFLSLPPELEPLRWWTKQLMEESLGKDGKGVIVFCDQAVSHRSPSAAPPGALAVRIAPRLDTTSPDTFQIAEPLLGARYPRERLAGIAATFLDLQLSMALFGYLHNIPFAGQPAVENYKRRARALRSGGDPPRMARATAPALTRGPITLLPPPSLAPSLPSLAALPAEAPVATLAAALASPAGPLAYLDLTINGEISTTWTAALADRLRRLANERLAIPMKLRRAPAAYHSTEQSEMDGPVGVLSVRALALRSEACLLGDYDATFLQAQAVATWQAMNEQGRSCRVCAANCQPCLSANRIAARV